MLAKEETVRRTYNEYRRSKGLEPFEAEQLTDKPTKKEAAPDRGIKFCINCLLECFKLKPLQVSGYFVDDMGINGNDKKNWRDPDLQIEKKRRFGVNAFCISSGFNNLNVPGGRVAN